VLCVGSHGVGGHDAPEPLQVVTNFLGFIYDSLKSLFPTCVTVRFSTRWSIEILFKLQLCNQKLRTCCGGEYEWVDVLYALGMNAQRFICNRNFKKNIVVRYTVFKMF